MVRRFVICIGVLGSIAFASAQDLFYTDFRSTPEGFKAASDAATANGKEDTLLVNPSGASTTIDTIIDGCTLTANKSSTSTTMIVISKKTQTCVPRGDTAGCTPGRLTLKNSGNSIKFPTVQGPCTITYYGAGSSDTASGRGFQFIANGISTPEGGISELKLGDSSATRKIVYSYAGTDTVSFTLVAIGGVYLYDVRIVAGTVGVIANRSPKSVNPIWTRDNLVINPQHSTIDFFSVVGKKIMQSTGSVIDIAAFPKGMYLARVAGSGEKIKITR